MISYKEIGNQIVGSQITEPEVLPTLKDKKEESELRRPNSSAVDRTKGESINQIIEELRKSLFKPIINITSYLQYVTKYSSLLMKIFKNKMDELTSQDKQIIAKSKACLNSLLNYINKLLYIE